MRSAFEKVVVGIGRHQQSVVDGTVGDPATQQQASSRVENPTARCYAAAAGSWHRSRIVRRRPSYYFYDDRDAWLHA